MTQHLICNETSKSNDLHSILNKTDVEQSEQL